MNIEGQPNPEAEANKPLTREQLDEVCDFVNGSLLEYLLKHETNNKLYRKAGITVEGDTAHLITNGQNKERIIAMPPDKQQELYRNVTLLKRLLEMGAGEQN